MCVCRERDRDMSRERSYKERRRLSLEQGPLLISPSLLNLYLLALSCELSGALPCLLGNSCSLILLIRVSLCLYPSTNALQPISLKLAHGALLSCHHISLPPIVPPLIIPPAGFLFSCLGHRLRLVLGLDSHRGPAPRRPPGFCRRPLRWRSVC